MFLKTFYFPMTLSRGIFKKLVKNIFYRKISKIKKIQIHLFYPSNDYPSYWQPSSHHPKSLSPSPKNRSSQTKKNAFLFSHYFAQSPLILSRATNTPPSTTLYPSLILFGHIKFKLTIKPKRSKKDFNKKLI